MKNRELAELLKYSSSSSILVVTYNNKLIELFCPFHVLGKYKINLIKKNTLYTVSRIKLSSNLKIVFVINDKPYHYYHFDILLTKQ